MAPKIRSLIHRIGAISRQGKPFEPKSSSTDPREVTPSIQLQASPKDSLESDKLSSANEAVGCMPNRQLGSNLVLNRDYTRPVSGPSKLNHPIHRIELFDPPHGPEDRPQNEEHGPNGPNDGGNLDDELKRNDTHSIGIYSFGIDGFRLDDFDIARQIFLDSSHRSSSDATTMVGMTIVQSVEDDSLLKPSESYTAHQLALRNRMRCPLCCVANPWYCDHPLGYCYACGADFRLEIEGIHPDRKRQAAAERDERIRLGLEIDHGKCYSTYDGKPPRSGSVTRQTCGNDVSTPGNDITGASGHSGSSNSLVQTSWSGADHAPDVLVIQTIRGAENARVLKSDRALAIYAAMMQPELTSHQSPASCPATPKPETQEASHQSWPANEPRTGSWIW
ncbi:hypothetical protein J1614_004765 [Plenodomus biglobosus]|nr:hypothetical protein J1614_004765 [Plenodomus biglobosus]